MPTSKRPSQRAAVVVLGDMGHSPRMQYHCLSLAEHGFEVDFVGYLESSPRPELTTNRRIHLYPLGRSARAPFLYTSQPWSLLTFWAASSWIVFCLPASVVAALFSVANSCPRWITCYTGPSLAERKAPAFRFVCVSEAGVANNSVALGAFVSDTQTDLYIRSDSTSNPYSVCGYRLPLLREK